MVTAAVGVSQYIVFSRQLNVMAGQLVEMRAEDRPWISVEAVANGDLIHQSNGWQFFITFKISNVGRAPAVDANFFAGMIPWQAPQPNPPAKWGFSASLPIGAVKAAKRMICDLPSNSMGGKIIFPGNSESSTAQVGTSAGKSGFIPGFIIIACATYRFTGDATSRETVQVFALQPKVYGQMIDVGASSYPLSSLAFFQFSELGSGAN